ncbi:MAG: ABC transporter ATP-binding protein [Verrucomicrobiales bacterium]|nr:ABC transporter ATP-binding protein [Verrucomicrobiales bacterium]
METVIDLHTVSKVYGNSIHALRNASMQVGRGEVFGLLGANGAGKSTLVKILLTLVHPTHCKGEMLGRPIGHVNTLRRIGYLPEHVRFPDHLTAAELLDFTGRLCWVAAPARQRRISELLAAVGMEKWKNERISRFSKGMKQRAGIAQALINDPDILFLDEPTDGVDPLGRKEIRELILALKARGKTVFVNSHLLSELEMICDRVAILAKGAVVRQGKLDELTRSGERYDIRVEGNLLEVPAVVGLVHSLGGTLGATADQRQSTIAIPTRRPQVVQPVIDELRRSGILIESIIPVRQTLEDLFMDTVSGSGPTPPRNPEALSSTPSTEAPTYLAERD